jgi:hypothetical protein
MIEGRMGRIKNLKDWEEVEKQHEIKRKIIYNAFAYFPDSFVAVRFYYAVSE